MIVLAWIIIGILIVSLVGIVLAYAKIDSHRVVRWKSRLIVWWNLPSRSQVHEEYKKNIDCLTNRLQASDRERVAALNELTDELSKRQDVEKTQDTLQKKAEFWRKKYHDLCVEYKDQLDDHDTYRGHVKHEFQSALREIRQLQKAQRTMEQKNTRLQYLVKVWKKKYHTSRVSL